MSKKTDAKKNGDSGAGVMSAAQAKAFKMEL